MKSIISKYDHIILDIWGVIHNGVTLLPYAEEFLYELIRTNKSFCFLSNAPRPAKIAHKRFTDLGLDVPIELITTSGDIFLNELNKHRNNRLFLIGEEKNGDLLANQQFTQTHNIEDAEFIIILAFGFNEDDLMQYNDLLEKAVKKNIPMFCPNPDIVVDNGGRLCYTPGAYAKIYKNMGGSVRYFGKPHKEAYEHVFEKYKFNPVKTLMIGDSAETDICGATNAGIDSVMLMSGIHRNTRELEEIFTSLNARPTYIKDNLKL